MTAPQATAVFPVVDAAALPDPLPSLLRPGRIVRTTDEQMHRLPRFFFAIDSWQTALATQLTEHFGLWEFMDVDLHEAPPLRTFPRYVPCAVTSLALALELFRGAVGTTVRIAANGGYRSPSHRRPPRPSTHCWATAANIYAIGDERLESEDQRARFGAIARRVLPFATVRPAVSGTGVIDDHLHIDIGYVTQVPSGAAEPGDDDTPQTA
jgi:hypothetical protein